MKVLLTDLFSTLIPGGEAARAEVNAQMGAMLGVDPTAFQHAFDASSYDRFIGAYGDLPATLRLIAERCGGTPSEAHVQQATTLRRTLAAGPLAKYFEATAFSAELGTAKPEPAIYRAACAALDVDPHDCIYVADGMDGELSAAAGLGMRTIRTLEHADSDPTWQGETITTFADLTTRLQ